MSVASTRGTSANPWKSSVVSGTRLLGYGYSGDDGDMFRPRLLAMFCLLAAFFPSGSCAQTPVSTLNAALLSDPHFDPFRNVSKVPRLAAAPVSQWAAILAEPAAADDGANFQQLQTACNERSVDAANDLMLSAFDAAGQKTAGGTPAFVLLAGDLLVHRFDCRYEKLLGHPAAATGTKDDDAQAHPSGVTASGLMDFAQKTVDYIALELHRRFPTTPVYISLGNNDTGCGDYQLDENDSLLAATEDAVARGWSGTSDNDARKARADYRRLGSYSLPLQQPFAKGRIVVLDDMYLSYRYANCKGKPDTTAGQHLLAWLDTELTAAESRGEFVWVLTHIPPGVNTYSTNVAGIDICAGKSAVTFLRSTDLTAVLGRHAKAVRVLIAGHTHVDETRVFGSDEDAGRFVVKGVPSISTVSGNPPAYLIAAVDPRTGLLQNYTLHVASSAVAGLPASKLTWHEAYDFRTVYREPAFTPAAVADMAKRFAAGAPADDQAIANYQNYFAGFGIRRLALQAVWGQYVCHMQHDDPKAFAACGCAEK